MRDSYFFGVGGVVSADIAVPDHEREVGFYSRVLTTGQVPLWQDDLMNNLGTPVIGLGARTQELDSLPLQWMPHFQVDDVAASVAAANEMGGTELMHSRAESGESQWAVLSDNDGATFGVIPVVAEESGSEQVKEPRGCIAWLSLMVPDAGSSREFYQHVVGWKGKPGEPNNREGEVLSFEMQGENGVYCISDSAV